jgi:hypothetical protein
MSAPARATSYLLALLGTAIGAVAGYYLFFWITKQGLYPMVIPGALMGLGCGALSGTKSNTIGVICAAAAVMVGLFIEWRFAPFVNDRSFSYLLTHVHQLRPASLIMIAVGGVFGYWFGRGREGGVWRRTK